MLSIMHPYNGTRNTGPYFLFGREAHLPVDMASGVSANNTAIHLLVEGLKKYLK